MIEQKQVQEGGHATFSVKVTKDMYDLVNILCEGLQHGTNGNDLFRMFIQSFIEAAKHDGPISPDMKHFLNLLKMEPGWHKAFNFADVTAQTEVAQIILILQQKGKNGHGLTMIDSPWMGEPTQTMCVDDILERVIKVSMPTLHKRLKNVGKRLLCNTIRETLTLLSEYMNDSLDKEEEQSEMPGYGMYHDFGRAIEYGQRTKRVKHQSPDLFLQQELNFEQNEERERDSQEASEWLKSEDAREWLEENSDYRPIGDEW